MNLPIINKWSYYYFLFGISPPIGLQNLEEKAVGGWSAHGFFYGPGKCRYTKIAFQIPLNPPLQRGTLTPPLEKGGLGGIFMLLGWSPRARGLKMNKARLTEKEK
jgi:hypothetical protein